MLIFVVPNNNFFMRHIILTFASALTLFFAAGCCNVSYEYPYSAAHRGAHVDGLIPENSPAGVAMAARMGFQAFELDVRYTLDSVMVVMHDPTINRTMRRASDYSVIEEKMKVSDYTFEDLRTNYVLASSDPELRTPIPTPAEILAAAKAAGITPMLHNMHAEAYDLAHEMFGDDFFAFDVSYDAVKYARSLCNCRVLWDPGKADAASVIARLDSLGGPCGVSSMSSDLLNAEFNSAIRGAGYDVQSSIFPCPKEMQCMADGANIILSDFSLFPKDREPVKQECRRSVKLAAGDSLAFVAPFAEFGSVDIAGVFSGDVEISVNGGAWTYPLSLEGETRMGGWRFHSAEPSIVIKAVSDANLSNLVFRAFAF